MVWFFRIFFGLIGLCLLIWLGEQARNWFTPRRSCPAVVQERRRQVFPVSVGFKRQERVERRLTFYLPQQQKTLSFEVSQALYEASPVGTGGCLTWKGGRLVRWEPQP